jgi:hypothetical protein
MDLPLITGEQYRIGKQFSLIREMVFVEGWENAIIHGNPP